MLQGATREEGKAFGINKLVETERKARFLAFFGFLKIAARLFRDEKKSQILVLLLLELHQNNFFQREV